MAISYRQAASETLISGTTVSKAFSLNVQPGSLLVAIASKPVTTLRTWSVADQDGRALTLAKENFANSDRQTGIWYYPNHPGGATTLTLTASGTTSLELCLIEYTGAASTSVLGGTSEFDNATAATHYAAATTGFSPAAGALIVAAFTTNGTVTTIAAGGGYTELIAKPSVVGGAALHGYLITSTALTDERPTITTTGTNRAGPACCAWFKVASESGLYLPFRSPIFQPTIWNKP